jgi:predicted SnoaL-like aldol condensation-catalyzing enzyme
LGTQFIKSSPYPISIAKQIKKVYEMPISKRREMGKQARQWVLDNFSIEVIGKQYEELIDSMPDHNWDFTHAIDLKNPNANIQDLPDNSEFVIQCYKEILNCKDVVKEDTNGYNYWIQFLSNPQNNRKQMTDYFRQVAQTHNQSQDQPKIDYSTQLLNNKKKNFLTVCKESAGDILYATATLKSLRESYDKDEWNIYFACDTQFKELLDGCQNIDKVLDYQPFMESEIACIGQGENKGLFQGYCFLTTDTQRHLSYLSNHKINLNLS